MDDHSSIGHTHLIRLVGLTPGSTHVTGHIDPVALHGRSPALVASIAAILAVSAALALAAPGDLDPSFGDVGRVVIGAPTLWSLDVLDDDAITFGGNDAYCGYYYSCEHPAGFGRLLPDGTPDAVFAAADLEDTFVYDTALQPDGKLVAVGQQSLEGHDRLIVIRLQSDGSLDLEFGTDGTVLLPDSGVEAEAGRAVVIEGDGRIVVAGNRGMGVVVARLNADGTLDESFGTGGIVTQATGALSIVALARVDAGYRVLTDIAPDPDTSSAAYCHVLALNDVGELDAAFGAGGRAAPPWQAGCTAFTTRDDGRIVLAGVPTHLAGLLPDGTPDAAFQPAALQDAISAVTAIELGAAGAIYVGGAAVAGPSGGAIVRLHANGTLDTTYGSEGSTQFALRTDRLSPATVNDMQVLPDGTVVIGGSAGYYGGFVARLLGDGGGEGPGIVSMTIVSTTVTEQEGEARLSVRRLGGSAGPVTVTYTATSDSGHLAVAGQDYTALTDTISWADGESGEREIVIPVSQDDLVERSESFQVVLKSIEVGAGLGAAISDVNIAGDSYPAGLFNFLTQGVQATEGGTFTLAVAREDHAVGQVSVTIRVASGSATAGQDFELSASTLTWADGEMGQKNVTVSVPGDGNDEANESVTFELASPTGGAFVGTPSTVTMQINDQPGGGNGGGGSSGLPGTLLLGLLAWFGRGWRHKPAH